MSLDILLKHHDQSSEWRMYLEDDAYYWFLYPTFQQVNKTCGQMIDLYGDAEFHGGKGIFVLQTELEKALQHVSELPSVHAVHLGTEFKLVRKELYANVEKGRLNEIIHDLLALIQEAKDLDVRLVFSGD